MRQAIASVDIRQTDGGGKGCKPKGAYKEVPKPSRRLGLVTRQKIPYNNINIYIVICGLICKVLTVAYSRLFRGTCINYNTVEFFKGIIFCGNIYKQVLFAVCNIHNKSNKCVYICTNLMVQASRIQGHEIRIVLYACLDGGDCRLYKADYVVYILMYLPPNQSVLHKCTRRVSGWLVHRTRKRVLSVPNA